MEIIQYFSLSSSIMVSTTRDGTPKFRSFLGTSSTPNVSSFSGIESSMNINEASPNVWPDTKETVRNCDVRSMVSPVVPTVEKNNAFYVSLYHMFKY